MKYSDISLLAIFVVLISCSNNNSSDENELSTEQDSTNVASNENEVLKNSISYDSLIFYIKNNEQIPCSYIENQANEELKCPLGQNILIQESDKYIIVESAYLNQAMDAYPYYLCSFSKESAGLISYVPIGHEAEGVEPNTIRWKSENEFTMIDCSYEFVEDEESGAYMRGALIDSTVSEYTIDSNGEISLVIGKN